MEPPNPPQSLTKPPSEILEAVGSFADAASLDAVTRAARRLREYFTSNHFRAVRFEDTQSHLSQMLRAFLILKTDEEMKTMRQSIRTATIALRSPPLKSWSNAGDHPAAIDQVDDALAARVVDCLSRMIYLQDITLLVAPFSDQQVREFNTFIL
ncbi:hypothetical protein EDB81DRAFT_770091 [Dactylonectria macrodidyma]|uniref:F-box domain-containing protein n=1 Tax=Dactylonectria macrodidyma TaxID=307937 RepID=A0A9P9FS82_9HYPO|nr:hypothetical protein EDB81DRAFT_770091 [Dactylonectria macrodidyma]